MTALPGIERHPHARAVLAGALAEGAVPSHAFLFHGPGGTGKRDVARAFAAELLAAGDPDPDRVRGRVARDAHPDLTWVAPSGAREMLTSDIDEPVVAAAARTPFEARRRVFVIEDVDSMNDEAANRLLKTLEEPASYVHLVLLTSRLGEVKKTISSRCQLVRFDPLDLEILEERLGGHGVAPDIAHACARLGLGDGERALELALGDGPALRGAAELFALGCLAGDLSGRPWRAMLEAAGARADRSLAEVEAQRDEQVDLVPAKQRRKLESDWGERAKRAQRRARTRALDLGLMLTGLWLRDVMALSLGCEDLVLASDRRARLDHAVAELAPAVEDLVRGMELVEETRQRLVVNVSEELALEALALRLCRELAG